jgi:hypothetical protein
MSHSNFGSGYALVLGDEIEGFSVAARIGSMK